MRRLGIVLGLFTVVSLAGASAASANPILQYTMRSVARDLDQVKIPASKPDPAEVTDAMILTAITRARTVAFQLDLVKERREGEMKPDVAKPVTGEELKAKLDLYASLLDKARGHVDAAEAKLREQLALAAGRDFSGVKADLAAADAARAEAHRIFRPQP